MALYYVSPYGAGDQSGSSLANAIGGTAELNAKLRSRSSGRIKHGNVVIITAGTYTTPLEFIDFKTNRNEYLIITTVAGEQVTFNGTGKGLRAGLFFENSNNIIVSPKASQANNRLKIINWGYQGCAIENGSYNIMLRSTILGDVTGATEGSNGYAVSARYFGGGLHILGNSVKEAVKDIFISDCEAAYNKASGFQVSGWASRILFNRCYSHHNAVKHQNHHNFSTWALNAEILMNRWTYSGSGNSWYTSINNITQVGFSGSVGVMPERGVMWSDWTTNTSYKVKCVAPANYGAFTACYDALNGRMWLDLGGIDPNGGTTWIGNSVLEDIIYLNCIASDITTPQIGQEGTGFQFDNGTHNSAVINCIAYNCEGFGIYINQGFGHSVVGNLVYDCSNGIGFNGQDHLIANNTVVDPIYDCLSFHQNYKNIMVLNNLLVSHAVSAKAMGNGDWYDKDGVQGTLPKQSSSGNATFYGNHIYNPNLAVNLQIDPTYFPNVSAVNNNLNNVDPKFVNANNKDYSLQTSSPCLNTGYDLTNYPIAKSQIANGSVTELAARALFSSLQATVTTPTVGALHYNDVTNKKLLFGLMDINGTKLPIIHSAINNELIYFDNDGKIFTGNVSVLTGTELFRSYVFDLTLASNVISANIIADQTSFVSKIRGSVNVFDDYDTNITWELLSNVVGLTKSWRYIQILIEAL